MTSQTREEAFGSMRTFLALANQATKNRIFSDEQRMLSSALIAVGGLLIALGPWLSGDAQTLGSWCHHAAGLSAKGVIQELVWLATQHCIYCYLGAALIGVGIATALRRPA